MANESIMGLAKDLTVPVLDKLSATGSAETYGERIGRLYRAVLKQVEESRKDILASRGDPSAFSHSDSENIT